MQSKKLTIKQSVLWNTCGNIIYFGVQWLQTILVARVLGYKDAGIFSLAMSMTNVFYALSIYGMVNFQVSDIEGKYSAGNYLISRYITGIVSLLLCLIFDIVNGYSFKQTLCIISYMFFKLSETLFDVCLGFYQRNWRMDLAGKSMVIRALLIMVFFTITILCTKNLLLAIVIMTLAVFCVVFLYDMKNIRILENINCIKNIRRVRCLLIECVPLAIYLILSTSIASIPRFFLEMYHGSEQLGIYASVATPTLIVQMAATYVFNPMITVFSESYNKKDKNKFINTFRHCVMVIAIFSVVAILGGKLFGKLGLSILYGTDIIKYEYLLIPLIVCTITTAFVWLLCAILTVLRDFRALLIGSGCAVGVSIILSVLCISDMGMGGTTYALLVGNIAAIIVLVYCMRKDIYKKFSNQE